MRLLLCRTVRRGLIVMASLTVPVWMSGCSGGGSEQGAVPAAPAASSENLGTLELPKNAGKAEPSNETGKSDGQPKSAGDLLERKVNKIESRLTRIEQELKELSPAVNRLILVENDIRFLLDRMETIAYEDSRNAPAMGANPGHSGNPAPVMTPLGQQSGQPISSLPAPDGQAPVAPPPPAPAADQVLTLPGASGPKPMPVPAVSDSMQGSSSGAYGLHLASYRSSSSARRGWAKLSREYSGELEGLSPVEKSFDPGNGKSAMIRLLAGSFPDKTSAARRCRTLKAAGQYCRVMPLR